MQGEGLQLRVRRETPLFLSICIVGILGITKAVKSPDIALWLHVPPHFNVISHFFNEKIERGPNVPSINSVAYRNKNLGGAMELSGQVGWYRSCLHTGPILPCLR